MAAFYPPCSGLSEELTRLFSLPPPSRASVCLKQADEQSLVDVRVPRVDKEFDIDPFDDWERNGRSSDIDEFDRLLWALRENCSANSGNQRRRTSSSGSSHSGGRADQNQGMGRSVCVFCRNNNEPKSWFTSHRLKDDQGHVVCPVLSAYTCPYCGATGSKAHTKKYCPKRTPNTLQEIGKATALC
ncbi:nanos homolog 2 [Lingula anatina]|uniref:Nanos homolog 2 n=1 Tax=Lingula anatina TaxID=7574 RepID=A0A1S3IKX6_LINAN|nr:nanos homolog 2 [Lingula anatina]|eukprot:XP_013398541.1 nanos homolog 2 [Lingula anatina]